MIENMLRLRVLSVGATDLVGIPTQPVAAQV